MSPDGSTLNAGPQGWRSIRPWLPPLSLSIREITSVSVTFILSSNVTDLTGDLEPSLASLALITAEENTEEDRAEGSSTLELKKKSIISDALAKGLSVNVNSSPWQRVFIRIDDVADEAVIIIYGLMPGRHYDVDLGLVQGDSNNKLRRQVTTEDIDLELEPPEEHTNPESPDFDHSTSSDPPASTPSTSPNRTLPNTPPSINIPLTIEDRLTQLQHTLSALNIERETLSSSLKSARRDAQKADAALRLEIDILKRASEKHVAAEHRAKQKMLSLQEALKRAQTATRETEELMKEVEATVPDLNKQRAEKEVEYSKIKEEADRVRKERDRMTEKEKKRLEVMKAELAGLTNKMEKLNVKKDKLEGGAISDLEEQLKDVELGIERVEIDAYAYTPFVDQHDFIMVDDHHPPGTEMSPGHSLSFPYLPVQRMRHQFSNPSGTIGRPSPAPIQRPTPNETFGHQPQLWSPPSRPPQATQAHNPRSSSFHQQTPVLLTNPKRRSSLKATNTPPANISAVTSTSLTSSPTPANANATTSTLSSRAPAFEPGRSLKSTTVATGTSSGFSASPTPIQRPGAGGLRGLGFGGHSKTKSNTTPWAGLRSPYDEGRG